MLYWSTQMKEWPCPRSASRDVVLALSGGAARCVAHVGVLQALVEAGIPLAGIVGTSGGAVVGALFASGRYSLEHIANIARDLSWRRLAAPALSRRGFLSSARLGRLIRTWIGEVNFAELRLPLLAVACELPSGQKIILSKGQVARAVQASCSLPVVFTPTTIEGKVLVDGGAVSQLPVAAARSSFPSSVVVGVDVNVGAAESARLTNCVQIGIHVVSLFARFNAGLERREADVMIDVDASGVALYDLRKADLMIRRGREAADSALGSIRKALAQQEK